MSKQDEAGLILKLYELRRDAKMREARDWFIRDFNASTLEQFNSVMFSEHGGLLRMVVSYWDMAAALVHAGAISLDLFNQTNQEHVIVFAKVEPLLAEIRAAYTPIYAANLEKLIDRTPDGRANVSAMREGMTRMRSMRLANQEPRT